MTAVWKSDWSLIGAFLHDLFSEKNHFSDISQIPHRMVSKTIFRSLIFLKGWSVQPFSDISHIPHRMVSKTIFPISLISLIGWSVGVVFLCQIKHYDALLHGPANLLRITIYWISLETIVNSIKILFDTSLPRVVGHEMLFLCVCSFVPSTVGLSFLMTQCRMERASSRH